MRGKVRNFWELDVLEIGDVKKGNRKVREERM